MKILIVSQYFWPEDFRVNDFAVQLVKQGHDVEVLTGVPNYPQGKFYEGFGWFKPFTEIHQGLKIRRAPLLSRGKAKGLRLVLNYLSFAVSASWCGLFFCKGPYDAILAYQLSPVTAALPAIALRAMGRGPVFFWVQDLWPESLSATGAVRRSWVLNTVGRLVRWMYRRSDLILIQSQAFRESILRWGGEPEKIRYFPNSAEALYQPLPSNAGSPQSQLLPPGFRIVFAGNIGVAQDFETILEAVQLTEDHPEIQWVILGDGRMRPRVEAEIKRRGLERRMKLLGRFPLAEMPHFFAEADALLVTLKDDPIFARTIPSKIQSYLACGRPILASLSGEGAKIIQESRAGLVCSPQNPIALAELARQFARLPSPARSEMGKSARAYYERFFDLPPLLNQFEGWVRNANERR